MTKKTPIIPRYDMDFEIFDWKKMHNQVERRHLQDIENQKRVLDERLSESEIKKNNAEIALIQKQIDQINRIEEEAKREAYERWLISPEGQAAIKKYNDRQYFVREKSINFLLKRPYNLLARKNLKSITYKNYISVIYWIFILFSSFNFNTAGNMGLFGSIIMPIIVAIFMAVIFILIFYFVYFEIKYFFQV